MTAYLISLGHRRIRLVTGHANYFASGQRLTGYRQRSSARGSASIRRWFGPDSSIPSWGPQPQRRCLRFPSRRRPRRGAPPWRVVSRPAIGRGLRRHRPCTGGLTVADDDPPTDPRPRLRSRQPSARIWRNDRATATSARTDRARLDGGTAGLKAAGSGSN